MTSHGEDVRPNAAQGERDAGGWADPDGLSHEEIHTIITRPRAMRREEQEKVAYLFANFDRLVEDEARPRLKPAIDIDELGIVLQSISRRRRDQNIASVGRAAWSAATLAAQETTGSWPGVVLDRAPTRPASACPVFWRRVARAIEGEIAWRRLGEPPLTAAELAKAVLIELQPGIEETVTIPGLSWTLRVTRPRSPDAPRGGTSSPTGGSPGRRLRRWLIGR